VDGDCEEPMNWNRVWERVVSSVIAGIIIVVILGIAESCN
jgi:hypothetical protein